MASGTKPIGFPHKTPTRQCGGRAICTESDYLAACSCRGASTATFRGQNRTAIRRPDATDRQPASGPAAVNNPGTTGYGSVLQGFVESSNVNPIEEITALIVAQRAYEMNSKVL